MTTPAAAPPPTILDPLPILKGFASLRRIAGTYPPGHPMIAQKLRELDDAIKLHLRAGPAVRIDVIHGDVFLDGVSSSRDKQANAQHIHDLVQLLIHKVARSNAALGQILAVKQYENLTYCHSVNVAMLSLLLGKQVGLDEASRAALVEAALLHDIGKTRIPLGILKKPGALDKRERKMMEAHTTFGAEILVQIEGLRPLTPIVALEHHRGIKGDGYPDVGDGVVPHAMSQIVSVA